MICRFVALYKSLCYCWSWVSIYWFSSCAAGSLHQVTDTLCC